MMREPTPEMIEAGARDMVKTDDPLGELIGGYDAMSRANKENFNEIAKACIKAALTAVPSPWRPIAEAKDRDVPNALLCIAGEPEVFIGSSRNGVWCDELDMVEPTHFMEIPAPPETGE